MQRKWKRYISWLVTLSLIISIAPWSDFNYYIPYESQVSESVETRRPLVFNSPSYVDLVIQVSIINEGYTGQCAMYDIYYEMNFQYDATFQILNVSKGTFDNAVIINSTAVRLHSTEIAYGSTRTGEVWNRVLSTPLEVRNDVSLFVTLKFDDTPAMGKTTTSITINTLDSYGVKIYHKAFTTYVEALRRGVPLPPIYGWSWDWCLKVSHHELAPGQKGVGVFPWYFRDSVTRTRSGEWAIHTRWPLDESMSEQCPLWLTWETQRDDDHPSYAEEVIPPPEVYTYWVSIDKNAPYCSSWKGVLKFQYRYVYTYPDGTHVYYPDSPDGSKWYDPEYVYVSVHVSTVPEFPSGGALEIALLLCIIFTWFKKRRNILQA